MSKGIQKIGVLLVSACLPVLVACGGTTTLVSTPDPSETASDIGMVEDSALEEEVELEMSSEESEVATAVIGSREIPAPVGSSALVRDSDDAQVWEVTLVKSTLNVNEIVESENQFNEPPPSGLQYAAAEFRVTYLGSSKGFPSSDLDVAFVTQEGTTHKPFDVSVVGPNPLSSANELYEGGSATGVVYIAIPTQNADQGTWRISQFLNDSEFFFQAK